MKIIQMNLDDFGIYHNVSWTPPEKGLIVMHGQNESGKTTLMKYVRSMFLAIPGVNGRGISDTWIYAGKTAMNTGFTGTKKSPILPMATK